MSGGFGQGDGLHRGDQLSVGRHPTLGSSCPWMSCHNIGGTSPRTRRGYQYRTVVRVLGKNVETMLDGCARSNHVTEELVVGVLNHAKRAWGLVLRIPGFP